MRIAAYAEIRAHMQRDKYTGNTERERETIAEAYQAWVFSAFLDGSIKYNLLLLEGGMPIYRR